jgi:homoserine O-succinyltransferase
MSGLPIFRGFDDEFYAPHSRHSEIRRSDIEKVDALTIISESEDAGVHIVMARNGREFFITGHSEYAPNTLDNEYKRDVAKGLPINIPKNYYRNDDPGLEPVVRWRGHANLLFSNWLNYYVYQETPYNINDIKE